MMTPDFANEESRLTALVDESRDRSGDKLQLHLRWLLDLYLENDQFDQAEPLLVEAIALARTKPESGRGDLSKLLADLAGLYEAKSRFEDAISVMRESVAVEKSASETRPLILANRLVQLGHLHSAHGSQAEAAECFKDALEWLPRKMPDTLDSNAHRRFKLISAALEGLDETDDAIRYQEIAIEIEREMCAPTEKDDPLKALDENGVFDSTMKLELADSLFNLGCLYLSKDRTADGESAFRESLEIRQALLPADHPRIARAREALASLPPISGASGSSGS